MDTPVVTGHASTALAVYGLLLAQRLTEVVASKRHVRARGGVPLVPPTGSDLPLYALHTASFAAPLAEAAWRGWPGPFVSLAPCVALLVAAQLVRLWTMRVLGDGWRIPAAVFPGDHIVSHGPYTCVRHPNHAAVIVELAVAPLLVGAPIAAVLVTLAHWPLVTARVRREELALAHIGDYPGAFAGRPRFFPHRLSLRSRTKLEEPLEREPCRP
jgi:methyltransferase